jgi:hypothetical protein
MLTVEIVNLPPAVAISQAAGQFDPTSGLPIHFTVVFTEPVTGLAPDDITVSGTAPGTRGVTVTGLGTTYDVALDGLTDAGTLPAPPPGGPPYFYDVDGNGMVIALDALRVINYINSHASGAGEGEESGPEPRSALRASAATNDFFRPPADGASNSGRMAALAPTRSQPLPSTPSWLPAVALERGAAERGASVAVRIAARVWRGEWVEDLGVWDAELDTAVGEFAADITRAWNAGK